MNAMKLQANRQKKQKWLDKRQSHQCWTDLLFNQKLCDRWRWSWHRMREGSVIVWPSPAFSALFKQIINSTKIGQGEENNRQIINTKNFLSSSLKNKKYVQALGFFNSAEHTITTTEYQQKPVQSGSFQTGQPSFFQPLRVTPLKNFLVKVDMVVRDRW